MRGSTPAEVTAEIRASGFRLFVFTKCSFATITAAAPSVIPEEFPAVTVPVFENTGASSAQLFQIRVWERMFVAAKDGCTFLAFDRYGNKLGVESSRGNRPRGAGLRHQRILILFLARNLVVLGQHFGSLAHYHFRHGTEESVAIHAVHQFLIAQPKSPARFQIIRKPRHGFRAPCQNATCIAEQNRLVSESNGLHPRSASFVHRECRDFLRHAAAYGNLPRRIWPAPRLPRVAEDGFLYLLGSIPARSIAALAATTPKSAAVSEASDPPNFPIGVRTAERI